MGFGGTPGVYEAIGHRPKHQSGGGGHARLRRRLDDLGRALDGRLYNRRGRLHGCFGSRRILFDGGRGAGQHKLLAGLDHPAIVEVLRDQETDGLILAPV